MHLLCKETGKGVDGDTIKTITTNVYYAVFLNYLSVVTYLDEKTDHLE